jgi:hypothetical protein
MHLLSDVNGLSHIDSAIPVFVVTLSIFKNTDKSIRCYALIQLLAAIHHAIKNQISYRPKESLASLYEVTKM